MLGPKEGNAVTVEWSLLTSLLMMLRQLLVWAILIPFLLMRSNRNKQAWSVLIPVIAVNSILFILMQLPAFPDESEFTMFSQAISAITIGLGVMWLLFYKAACRSRLVSFFIAAGIMAAVGIGAFFCYTKGDFSGYATAFLIIYGIGTIAIATGLSVTTYIIRTKFTSFRFLSRLLLIVFVFSIVCTVTFFSINVLIEESLEFQKEILEVLLVGSLVGIIIYLILVPFVILTFKNSLYRSRFETFYRIDE